MKVFLNVLKTVALEVASSDQIKDVKEKFGATEGVTSDLQELYFDGKHMKDVQTLADYGVSEGSILNMLVCTGDIPIIINIPSSGRILKLEMKSWETVLAIKTKIYSKERIAVDRQTLIYLGKNLEDMQTLAACNITKNSTLLLIVNQPHEFRVHINVASDTTFVINVKPGYSIRDVKTLIEYMKKIPADCQRLVYAEEELEDQRTLYDCKIRNFTTIHLKSVMQILVKTVRGNTITLEVEDGETITSVKRKIEAKVGIPAMKFGLVFGGKSLLSSETVEKYGILKGNTIYMKAFGKK